MKHLRYFEQESDYQSFKNSSEFVHPNVSYAKDSNTVFYYTIKNDADTYKIYVVEKKNISQLTYNMVDLGLSSGLLWADRNIGASSPEEPGTYFAWGETEGYTASAVYVTATELCPILQPFFGDETTLTPDNIDTLLSAAGIEDRDLAAHGIGTVTDKCFSADWSDYFDTTDGGKTFNKYNNVNTLTILDSSDDAATVNMGSEYRMPTQADFVELVNNCTVTFIDRQGNEFSESEVGSNIAGSNFKGIKFTGPNNNSIFIPAVGECSESMLWNMSDVGCLWGSNLIQNFSTHADVFVFYGYGVLHTNTNTPRYQGYPVRGVCSK